MKAIYTLIFVLMTGTAYGQSNLPACQGSGTYSWINCFGNYTWTNGNKYVGEWKDGQINGQGTFTFANGDKYVGEHKDAMRNGQGTLTFADGMVLLGEFVANKANGRLIVFSANGSIKNSGIFKDGILVTSQYIDPNSFTRIPLGNAIKDTSDNLKSAESITFDVAKLKCEELGFKPETEGFGKCVLQLTK